MNERTDLTGPLSEHAFLAGMDAAGLARINALARAEVLPAGQMIFREGEPAARLYLIRYGQVSLEVHAPGSHGIVVDSLGDGDVLGWSWLLAPYRWAFDARASQMVRAISVDAPKLRAEMYRDPAFGMDILSRMAPVMGRRLAEARHCIVENVVEPALAGGGRR